MRPLQVLPMKQNEGRIYSSATVPIAMAMMLAATKAPTFMA